MKNAHRNLILAAAAALTLAVAPSAPADVRIHLNLPLPPAPHEVLRHLPVPPLPVVGIRHKGHDGRWNYENRYRDDRYGSNVYRHDTRYRSDRWAFVEGRWIVRPYRGAVWVTGTYDPWGRWIPGYWARPRYR
jgi:hypothetical protein